MIGKLPKEKNWIQTRSIIYEYLTVPKLVLCGWQLKQKLATTLKSIVFFKFFLKERCGLGIGVLLKFVNIVLFFTHFFVIIWIYGRVFIEKESRFKVSIFFTVIQLFFFTKGFLGPILWICLLLATNQSTCLWLHNSLLKKKT